MSLKPPNLTGFALGVALTLVLVAGTAGAAALITSQDIKDGTIQSKDVKDGTIQSKDVKDGTIQSKDIKDGTIQSKDIKNGNVTNADVQDGTLQIADLSAELLAALMAYEGANWSIVDRNVIGNGDAFLRAGPSPLAPPMGVGSLGMRTGGPDDAAAFGNQIDYFDVLVADITTLQYSVFTTQENIDQSGNVNLPNIKFEIVPNLGPTPGFTTMVFVPGPVLPGWTDLDAISDDGLWGLTGSEGVDTGCDLNATLCTWDDLQTALNDGGAPATIITVQFGKGRDFAYSGAVDKLVINADTYDFEPNGVFKTSA